MTKQSFTFIVLFIPMMTKAERKRQFIIEKSVPILIQKELRAQP